MLAPARSPARPPGRPLAPAVSATLLFLLASVASCRGGSESTDASAPQPAPQESDATAEAPQQTELLLLFPGIDDDLLHAEKRSVIPLRSPEERAKQCLSELFRGPSPGLLAAVPDGASVKEVYLLGEGTAWVDLSNEMLNLGGGSTRETLAIYSIVDTITLNVPEIKRLGILVGGQTRETLAGHIDTTRPFSPAYQLLEESARPAPSEPPANGGAGTGEGDATGGDEGVPEGASEGTPQGTGDGSAEREGEGTHERDGTTAHPATREAPPS